MQENVIESTSYNSVNVKSILYFGIKRFVDIIGSLVGLIFLLPICLIVKISYVLHKDFNSIFFTQYRIGKDGNLFKFYKFRTMVPNADDVLFELLKKDKKLAKEYKINKKLKNDPRITKMGKHLRNSSLDELPQLINVLKGDMSLVGNRPYLPREQDDMGEYFDDIIKTKPGLTGYWQVSGRSDTSFDYRLKLEKYYSNNYSLLFDIKILLSTVRVVLLKKGAK